MENKGRRRTMGARGGGERVGKERGKKKNIVARSRYQGYGQDQFQINKKIMKKKKDNWRSNKKLYKKSGRFRKMVGKTEMRYCERKDDKL